MAEACAMSGDRVLPPVYSLPQALDRLPSHARERYEALRAMLDDSEALQRSLQERIKAKEERLAALMRRRSYASVPGGDAAEVERLNGEFAGIRTDLDKLDRERSRRSSVRANTEQIVSRLNNFIMQWFSGAVDVAAPPRLTNVPVGRRRGESLADALLRVRREVAVAQAELMRVKAAPPPKEEVQLALIQEIDRLAREGRPQVVNEGGKVMISWPDIQMYASPGQPLSAPSGSASRLLCALFPTELKKLLIASVEDVSGGIAADERPRRILEMEQNIYALEIAEERLVCQALDSGLEVHRRPDVNPLVLLGYGLEEAHAQAAE
jgi:hypothetical protein